MKKNWEEKTVNGKENVKNANSGRKEPIGGLPRSRGSEKKVEWILSTGYYPLDNRGKGLATSSPAIKVNLKKPLNCKISGNSVFFLFFKKECFNNF